uniref:Uncharacterized protein n=1 Tax=Arundo donax TaxID=35708 RepID=A0A0A8XXN1_ARUDO
MGHPRRAKIGPGYKTYNFLKTGYPKYVVF